MWIAFSGLDLQFRRLGLLDFRLDFDICLRTRLSRRRVADYESDPVEGRISGQGVIHVYRREILRKLGKERASNSVSSLTREVIGAKLLFVDKRDAFTS